MQNSFTDMYWIVWKQMNVVFFFSLRESSWKLHQLSKFQGNDFVLRVNSEGKTTKYYSKDCWNTKFGKLCSLVPSVTLFLYTCLIMCMDISACILEKIYILCWICLISFTCISRCDNLIVHFSYENQQRHGINWISYRRVILK